MAVHVYPLAVSDARPTYRLYYRDRQVVHVVRVAQRPDCVSSARAYHIQDCLIGGGNLV